MGWGIRGQFGHQTGAMIAGVLVGLVFVLRFLPHHRSIFGARAAAFFTLGISLGGSMTYGQTLGLTQNPDLIGNWEAFGWGITGVFVKGAVWISLAGFFLGMALSSRAYRPLQIAMLICGAIFIRFLGIEIFNEPYAPDERMLPHLYFSASWYWQPGQQLSPRRELWGGLLFSLVAMALFTRCVYKDRLALRLAIWGAVAGGMGFASGQCVQAFHAWNIEWFRHGMLSQLEPLVNWWNMMEIVFGAVFAAILSLGVWLNRHLIAPADENSSDGKLLGAEESFLLAIHSMAVAAWSFGDFQTLDDFADIAFTMILLPMVAVKSGKYWPYMVVLPVVMLPIAGKTLRQVSYKTDLVSPVFGWSLLVAVPLGISIAAAIYFAHVSKRYNAQWFARRALVIATVSYFSLNFVFFELPWPWQAWTNRTPSAIIFSVCAALLLSLAIFQTQTTAQD